MIYKLSCSRTECIPLLVPSVIKYPSPYADNEDGSLVKGMEYKSALMMVEAQLN